MKFKTKNRGLDLKVMKRDVHKLKKRNMRREEFKNDSLDISRNGNEVHGRLTFYEQTGFNTIVGRSIDFSCNGGSLKQIKEIGKKIRKHRKSELNQKKRSKK